jgi:hypothetical protein
MKYTSSVVGLLLGALGVGCGQATHTPSLVPVGLRPAVRATDTLKVHMKSGELYMLQSWALDTAARTVSGSGRHYTLLRQQAHAAAVTIPLDSVALFETNKHTTAWPLGMQGVALMTTMGAYVSAVCLMDPKSCFGSCPTFYVEGQATQRVQAEGFSASVARVLEERDVDALPRAGVQGRRVFVRMKNEAWETHAVRSVNLLAAIRPAHGRVFAAPDSHFYAATHITQPTACTAAEGDCLGAVARLDDVERRSAADSLDLAAREVVELSFDSAPLGRTGLVLTARNSLITTFLFYQSMAYAGRHMGAMVAAFERNGREFARSHFGMASLLGAIDVEVQVDGAWRTVGTFGEHGPIAADTKIIPLPADLATDRPLRVRLRMAKGNWRVDWAALAELGDTVSVTRIAPRMVERHGREDRAALAALLDTARTLVSLPGDDFRLRYELPAPAQRLELFLESQGWYYEWQRQEWLAEEDAAMAAMALLDPARALRLLAPAYKAREDRMERLFWASRFNRTDGGSHAPRH